MERGRKIKEKIRKRYGKRKKKKEQSGKDLEIRSENILYCRRLFTVLSVTKGSYLNTD